MNAQQTQIDDEKRKQYAGVYLLYVMINERESFPLLLEGDDQPLEHVLDWLHLKGYIDIDDENGRYIPNEKGREVLCRFMGRYADYLKVFDVYCAVDLEAGEFAFAKYFDFPDDSTWRNHLDQDNWEDLRLAVASYKKLDPVEIVFMSFLNEDRFGRDGEGWQFDLLLGTIWDEVIEIVESALKWNELGFENDEGSVEAESVIEDIIKQGSELMISLLKEEESRRQDDDDDDDDDDDESDEGVVVEEVVIEEHPVGYYEPYIYDPFYISPVWVALWLI